MKCMVRFYTTWPTIHSSGMEDDYPVWVDVMLQEKDYQKEWWE